MADYNPTLPKQRDGVVWSGPDDKATKTTGLIHFAYIPPSAGTNRRVSVLVMLHGFGGNERQMWEYVSGLPQNLAIITPRAPNTAKGDGSGRFSWGTNQAPLANFIHALPEIYPVDPLKVYIAGFSEGAALGSKYALSHSHIAGLAMFSGRLGMQPADKVKFPVFIAHGKGDDQIPLEEAHKAREALTKAGAEVQAKDYGGRHYSTDQAKADFVSWMRSIHTSETKAALLDEWFLLEALKATITSPSGTYHDPATGKFTSRPAGQGPAKRDWSKWGGKPGGKKTGIDSYSPPSILENYWYHEVGKAGSRGAGPLVPRYPDVGIHPESRQSIRLEKVLTKQWKKGNINKKSNLDKRDMEDINDGLRYSSNKFLDSLPKRFHGSSDDEMYALYTKFLEHNLKRSDIQKNSTFGYFRKIVNDLKQTPKG